MLTCLPKGICSWNFRIQGASSGPVELEFNFFSEQGRIALVGKEYAVRKHGVFSGHWTLEGAGGTVAEAHKPSAFFRSFDVRSGHVAFTAKARSPFGRGFEFLTNGGVVGSIRTAHPFTRRSFIECTPEIPELDQLFAFWLAVLTWRRAARNNSGGAGQ